MLHGCVTDNANDIENYDLIIVGSGSGNSIPEYLADWRIAIVERGTFGGTCLNVGCIPSKMFVLPADKALEAQHSAKLGIDTQFNGADWGAIRDRVFGRIDDISAGGRDYRATRHAERDPRSRGPPASSARRCSTSRVARITAPNILLAAGARPVVPPIPGLVETGFHTSDTIMRLDDLPEQLGIIGGGFISVEMGHVFSGLGAKVTLMNRSNGLLRGFDGEIAARFTEVFGERVDLHLGHVPTQGRADATTGGSRSSAPARNWSSTSCWSQRAASRTATSSTSTRPASSAITTARCRSTTRWPPTSRASGRSATWRTATS